MPRKKRKAIVDVNETKQVELPEDIEFLYKRGEYAIVKIRLGDLERIRMLKLPEELRAYRRKIQKEYRERLKEKKKLTKIAIMELKKSPSLRVRSVRL